MSIWCSWDDIGYDGLAYHRQPSGGEVRSYANGWSNHYPDTEVEQPASINLAHIAPWCVPGHADGDRGAVGPWLRLGVDAAALPWIVGRQRASVVLDEAAVRKLHDELGEWLGLPKVHPPVASPAQDSA